MQQTRLAGHFQLQNLVTSDSTYPGGKGPFGNSDHTISKLLDSSLEGTLGEIETGYLKAEGQDCDALRVVGDTHFF